MAAPRVTGTTDAGSVQIEGLNEFVRELRKVDPELRKQFVGASREAARVVLTEAQARSRSYGTDGQGAVIRKAGTLIKVQATNAGSGIVLQRKSGKNPYVAAAEFGSPYRVRTVKVGRRAVAEGTMEAGNGLMAARASTRTIIGWKQFKPYRGNGAKAGYFVYPAIRAKMEETVAAFARAVDDATKRAFPEGR